MSPASHCILLGFVAGAAWLQQQESLPSSPAWALAGALALALLAGWLVHRGPLASLRNVAAPRALLAALSGAATGYCWAALLAAQALSTALPAADEGRDLTITGVVDSLPGRVPQGVRFNFVVEQVDDKAARVPPRIALSWFADQRDAAPLPEVKPGQRWQLPVRLQRPHGYANPYGFDYELWLLEQGLRATGYVRQQAPNRLLAEFVPGFGNTVERSRDALRERILRALPHREYAGVIVALVIGDQRAISQSDWNVFNRTGISHLVSISGLHITMIAGLVAWAASALWRRSFFTRAQLPLLLPAQKVAAIAGALAALAYVLLAGFGVPAQRTLYMLTVVAVALWLDRLAGITQVLCLAAAVTVLLDPWAVMWPGYWLSFGAVATILYATSGRHGAEYGDINLQLTNEWWQALTPASSAAGGRAAIAGGRASISAAIAGITGAWRERLPGVMGGLLLAARVQYAVTVGLVPLTMLLFAQVSLASPLANAVAIPVVSLLVTPLALAGSLLPEFVGTPLLQLAHGAVWLLAQALNWLSAWPYAVWAAPTPAPWAFAWAALGTLWMLAPRGWPVRWLGAVTWLPLLLAGPGHPASGQFRVTAFDVGQGMALLVETARHRLLYDTGPAYSPESNGGSRVILPYLKARGIAALDGVIVSHADTDHSGGALAILEGRPVGWLASSLPPAHPIVHAARRHVRCAAGQAWTWDGVRFDILHPSPGSYGDASLKTNARSCVLKVSAAGHAILLAGDIEAPQEAQMLERGGALQAEVLLAPHHGSGTSSTEPFLRAVAPSAALFQVGYRNRYHHPQGRVLDRYAQLGIACLRSDQHGAIILDSADLPRLQAYRIDHARYWYGR